MAVGVAAPVEHAILLEPAYKLRADLGGRLQPAVCMERGQGAGQGSWMVITSLLKRPERSGATRLHGVQGGSNR